MHKIGISFGYFALLVMHAWHVQEIEIHLTDLRVICVCLQKFTFRV